MINNETKKYFGYSIDLLNELSEICNFTFVISLINTIKLKSKNNRDNLTNWNFIVNELINKVGF